MDFLCRNYSRCFLRFRLRLSKIVLSYRQRGLFQFDCSTIVLENQIRLLFPSLTSRFCNFWESLLSINSCIYFYYTIFVFQIQSSKCDKSTEMFKCVNLMQIVGAFIVLSLILRIIQVFHLSKQELFYH